ncbi:hypothetical protein BDDG_11678, partial [Blastomyces dermatitidis ATCC 18188]
LITSVLQLCDLSLIQLAFHIHSHKETFTILHHSFTNFSHSSTIFFIIIIIKCHYLIQDFYFFFCSTLFICSSITLYVFLTMTLCSHNKHHCSAHTEQFVSKSSHVDRSVSADDSEPSVESLIENLKNVIMKKLSVLCMIRSSASLSASSVTSFPAALSQSSTLAPVSGSLTLTTSVPATPTLTTSGFAASVFLTSSPCFKEMLHRLSESSIVYSYQRITSSLNSVKIIKKIVMDFAMHKVMMFTDIKKLFTTVKFNITGTSALMNFFEMIDLYQPILWHLLSDFMVQAKDIHVFRNRNTDVVLFYICGCEACTPCLRCCYGNELFTCCVLLSAFPCVPLSLSEKSCVC